MDKVVHFEIPAEDTKRATEFYKKVFGWQIEKYPEMEYYVVKTVEVDEKRMPKEKGAINGGIMKKNAEGESTVIVINVPSIEEHLKKIEEAGGKKVMETQNMGGMGLYARVQDTEGNVIGIWQDLKK